MFAIEYAVPGLAEIYANTGATYAKLQPIFGVWGNLEPEPGTVQLVCNRCPDLGIPAGWVYRYPDADHGGIPLGVGSPAFSGG